MKESMLTTMDNPYNPFDDFDAWYAFDDSAGYNTCGFLARVVVTSPSLSEADAHRVIEVAIDEIVRENVNGLYMKVSREVPNTLDEEDQVNVSHDNLQESSVEES